jgi:nucleotide-binding universal stress UspA family protein
MRLLIATDGSASAEAALHLGKQFLQASRFGETPTILTVIEREAERSRALSILTHAHEVLGQEAGRTRTKVRIGPPVPEIIAEVRAQRYDLLIIGVAAGQGLLARLRGSTMLQLVEKATCSVAIAKGQIRPLERILICDSGAHSPTLLSRFISQVGALLADHVVITVLHVMSQIAAGPAVSSKELQAGAEELMSTSTPEGELLAQDIRVLEDARVHSTPKVRHGLVVDEILAETHTGDYDLVVIGAHHQEGWTSFLLDNLARQIITQIDRPVLLVR